MLCLTSLQTQRSWLARTQPRLTGSPAGGPCLGTGLALVVMVLLMAAPAATPGQAAPATVSSGTDGMSFELRYTVTYSPTNLTFGELNGYDTVSLRDGHHLNLTGAPSLPAQLLRVALPPGMAVTNVRLARSESVELDGEYTVFPAQRPTPITGAPAGRNFVGPDPGLYASPQAYPPAPVEFLQQSDLAGQGKSQLRVCPLQYVGARHKLILHTDLEIVLQGVGGYVCGDYLPVRFSEQRRAACRQALARMVVNPDDVRLLVSDQPPAPSRGVGPGSYDYVIITQSSWVDDFQPLADWRTRQGLPATIATTSWIYNDGGYSGTNLEKIRAFVQDAHSNWGSTFFLLGGDTDVIPYHVRTITVPDYWTDDIPNDTYYADYDEDWVCEVHLNRASVADAAGISTFLDKVFTYEKDPPLSDYATTAAFFGFDISETGDQYGETAKEDLRSSYLPPAWTLNTEYDSEAGTHKADVIAYLNQGHHLVNHHDHCNWNCMGAGWISHGDLLQIANVNNLSNGDRQSIVFAVGCWPCNFPSPTCIGEAFLRNSAGGAVAFMGNTRTGWGGSVEDFHHYSVLQDDLLYESLFQEGLYRLGECFSYLKNNAFEGHDPYNLGEYCFTQMHLLGDPGLAVWTDQPQSLTVSHATLLSAATPTSFPVQVYCGVDPVDGATVCLCKEGDVYQVQSTVAGLATFGLTPATTGTMYVTVSGPNYLPYEGQASVRSNGDFDTDGDVDLVDFATFALCFTNGATAPPPGCSEDDFEATDLDGDGGVDLTDFATFALNYTG